MYTWGIKDVHKCWSESLAKKRHCLGPAGVINCTPISALSLWVSLFPGRRGYNKMANVLIVVHVLSQLCPTVCDPMDCIPCMGGWMVDGLWDSGWMVGWINRMGSMHTAPMSCTWCMTRPWKGVKLWHRLQYGWTLNTRCWHRSRRRSTHCLSLLGLP